MALEVGKFLGPFPIENWHTIEGRCLIYSLDSEDITHAILCGKGQILESIEIASGGCIVVRKLIRNKNASYQARVITFDGDSIPDLNKFVRNGPISPKFRVRS